MIIYKSFSKGKSDFTRAGVKNTVNYKIGDQLIPEASSCK